MAHDRPEALGDRDLEVGGDPRALLLRRMARVAGTVARPPRGLGGELALQEPLAARPAPDQHGGGDRCEGEERLARQLAAGSKATRVAAMAAAATAAPASPGAPGAKRPAQ